MKNLLAEMVRNGVTNANIQSLLDLSERAVRMKLNGESPFLYLEIEKIRDAYFPGMRLEYLMAREERKAG